MANDSDVRNRLVVYTAIAPLINVSGAGNDSADKGQRTIGAIGCMRDHEYSIDNVGGHRPEPGVGPSPLLRPDFSLLVLRLVVDR